MNALTISAEALVTLPKELLSHLGVHPGDRISFEKLPGGEVRIRAVRTTRGLDGFFGSLRREGQMPVSIEDMNETIEQGWAART